MEEVFRHHVRKYESKDFVEVPFDSSLRLIELDFGALSFALTMEVDAVYSRIRAYSEKKKDIFHLKSIEQPPEEGYQYECEYKESVDFFELCNELAALNEVRRKQSFTQKLSVLAILISLVALFKN